MAYSKSLVLETLGCCVFKYNNNYCICLPCDLVIFLYQVLKALDDGFPSVYKLCHHQPNGGENIFKLQL